MDCKNCKSPLEPEDNYCTCCGARVIRNRLSFKNVWEDVYEQYLNLDNRLLATMGHLFTKPEKVIVGYLHGLRKKYLNPSSYLGLAITLSGIIVFVIKKMFLGELDLEILQTGASKKFEITLDYQSLIFILLIPMIAGIGRMVYKRPGYNFTEHLVSMTYALAHVSIVTFPITLLLLFLDAEHFMVHSFGKLTLFLMYTIYVYKRISDYPIGIFLLRTLFYLILFLIGYLLFSVLIVIVLQLTGSVSFASLNPK